MKERRIPDKGQWAPGVLRQLGVHGLDDLEDGYLAGLALGDPVLLLGGIGQAKTLLAERTALAMRLRFIAYSAEKALFEDILGPFDPRALMNGQVDYLQTEVTIWDKEFVLIDELSRANPSMQNKWLEVIRSRRVMGKHLSSLRYVLAAMNPPGLLGTHPLDEALAGRFQFLLTFPEVLSMSPSDQRRVVETRSESDAPGLGGAANRPLLDLEGLLKAIRDHFPAVQDNLGEMTSAYVLKVAEYLKTRDHLLDGRRLAMMRRGLLGLVAAHQVQEPDGTWAPESARFTERVLDLYRHGLDMLLPGEAIGKIVPVSVRNGAHDHAVLAIQGRPRQVISFRNLVQATRQILDGPTLDPELGAMLVSRITQVVERPTREDLAIQAGAAMILLVLKPEALKRFPVESRHRLLTCWRDACSVPVDRQQNFLDESRNVLPETTLPPEVIPSLLRCAYVLSSRVDQMPAVSSDFERVVLGLIRTLEEGGVP